MTTAEPRIEPEIQPATFVFTDAEAEALQSVQMARQAGIARRSPQLIAMSFGVPLLLLAAVFGIDRVWFGGEMPPPLSFGLLAAFVAGMLTQGLTVKLTLESSKRRMRRTVRQVFAPRIVRLTDSGIEQALPELRTVHAWAAIDRAERYRGLILLWSGPVVAVAIPERAFASAAAAEAFATACRAKSDAAKPAEGGLLQA